MFCLASCQKLEILHFVHGITNEYTVDSLCNCCIGLFLAFIVTSVSSMTADDCLSAINRFSIVLTTCITVGIRNLKLTTLRQIDCDVANKQDNVLNNSYVSKFWECRYCSHKMILTWRQITFREQCFYYICIIDVITMKYVILFVMLYKKFSVCIHSTPTQSPTHKQD